MPTSRRALCVVALTLAACPAVPSVDSAPSDTEGSWDAEVTPPPELLRLTKQSIFDFFAKFALA